MHFPFPTAGTLLRLAVAVLLFLAADPGASDEPAAQMPVPDFAIVNRALDGATEATETLLACTGHDADCQIVAAAALHRQGRIDALVELLRPAVARGDELAAKVLAEVAFESGDYKLAWAAGSIWMETRDLVLANGAVEDQGIRIPWLMSQSARRLSDSELDLARELAGEIRSSHEAEQRSVAPGRTQPDAITRNAPEYPRELLEKGIGGWTLLVLSVSADGRVEDVRELFSSHRALTRASIAAIRQWRYEPADQGAWWTHQIMEFELIDWQSSIPEEKSGMPDEQGWIRFDDARGWIEFTVQVNGVPARAMLDSGAESNAISRRLAERAGISVHLGNQVSVQGIYGQRNVPVSGAFELQFGQAKAPISGALVLPASSADLILGIGLFQASVVQIDYPNKRIRFLNRDAVSFEGNVRVRTRRGGSPQVAARLHGRTVWMLLDTGNSGATLFKRRLIQRMGLDQPEADLPQAVGSGAVSGGRSRLLQLAGFELGPFPFETLLAAYLEESGRTSFDGRQAGYGSRIRRDNVTYDGILGSEVLKNFIITIDLKRREVHFALP